MQVEMYAYWVKYEWRDEYTPILFDSESTSYDYHFVGTVMVDMPPTPDRAVLVANQVTSLRKQQAEHQNAITELERKIMELQCIECK
jgi:hypothetical protein